MTGKLEGRMGDRIFRHFEHQLVRLFDYQAQNYYAVLNPVMKNLLPKMHYRPEKAAGLSARHGWGCIS
ncbi:hypothetical protein OOT00_03755 [Desulfobotulus sp. H1]|uniref:Uncharacterized protein n=1 Tax=Desulfobotulus pelophilus TaxID=2823377 RepID=A0ABT3N6K5_9BACT|nr:hypothetical protein [Desulfobotulus pelophilus]MCW7753099.1 hypothetical protein [Desulfobotulus pelophilus]